MAAINQYGLTMGYHLNDEVITAWQNQGKNCTNRDVRGWHTSTSPFSGDRIITGFQEINGIVGFAVSGTGESWYLRAEGFKEFEKDYLKAQSTGSSSTELTSLPEKWCIKVTEENKYSLDAFKISKGKNPLSKGYYSFVDYQGFGMGENYNGSYQQITFDQFKKWVLKEKNPTTQSQKFIPGEVYWSNNNHNKGYIYKVKEMVNPDYVKYSHQIFINKLLLETNSGLNNAHWENLRIATPSEKQWLEACIKAGKFVPNPVTPQQTNNSSLLEEAKRRYPVGTRYSVAHLNRSSDTLDTIRSGDEFSLERNSIDTVVINSRSTKSGYTPCVYKNNKWAEIIEMTAKASTEPVRYVEALPGARKWFSDNKPTTDGKIYTFPNIVFDNGVKAELNQDINRWTEEFKPSTKEAYERQQNSDGIYIHKGNTPGKSVAIDIETAPLKRSWYEQEVENQLKYFSGINLVAKRPIPQFKEFFPDYFSQKPQPSSKVSVKSHEEFKINIIKPKTIKL